MLSLFTLTTAGLVASSGPAAASVSTDQSDIARLEQQVQADGARAQSLVSHFNEVQAQVDTLDAQIAHDEERIAADRRVEADAMTAVRRVAVRAYTTGSGADVPPLAMLSGTSNITTQLEQNQYLGAVGNKWDAALTTLHLDQARTAEAQSGLRDHQAQAKKSLGQLANARDAATAAIASDEAKLSRVKGNLRSLLAAANAKHEADELAAEHALAAATLSAPAAAPAAPTPSPTLASSPPSSPPPASVSPPVSSGNYANPLRAITALTPERIDQGVDYAGFGPIYAIGDGVVLNTVASGWPGGTFIAYRLTNGPASGLVVFAAEDIEPGVQVGMTVTSETVIGHMYAGPDGIETGWANGSRLPDTMARTYGQFNGSNSSAFGYNFSQLLQSVGAPGGIANGPPSGELPASWPHW
jgi:murein DD-endopeptidase MepM/ murein hydrolase activator NlpD